MRKYDFDKLADHEKIDALAEAAFGKEDDWDSVNPDGTEKSKEQLDEERKEKREREAEEKKEAADAKKTGGSL